MTPTSTKTPELKDGDRLSRDEFERRYDAMPNLKKAELIEGVVYMASPVRIFEHAAPHAKLIHWLVSYESYTRGICVADNGSLRLDTGNMPQPDASLFTLPEYGGRATISADSYLEGSPELIAEVAASTASVDLGAKLRAYKRNRVSEYLVWRVEEEAIDWFRLESGTEERLPLGEDGIYRSEAFPGLWLLPEALIALDSPRLLQVLERGLASPEHAQFVARLHEAQAAHLGRSGSTGPPSNRV